jgi:hypothetical protein
VISRNRRGKRDGDDRRGQLQLQKLALWSAWPLCPPLPSESQWNWMCSGSPSTLQVAENAKSIMVHLEMDSCFSGINHIGSGSPLSTAVDTVYKGKNVSWGELTGTSSGCIVAGRIFVLRGQWGVKPQTWVAFPATNIMSEGWCSELPALVPVSPFPVWGRTSKPDQ